VEWGIVVSHPFRNEREKDGAPGRAEIICKVEWGIVVSHPFRNEREKDGAPGTRQSS
jgi:hypothetical protein